jgi:folylpolyglutamate synthase
MFNVRKRIRIVPFRKPTVVGITSLGLEHQAILGYTLEEIALNKAGIMKENAPAFTVYNHENKILQLLHNQAEKVKVGLQI